jgi:probable selenium-dependent hydroxylase accessory protein YqeC
MQQKTTLLTGEFTEDERVKGPGEELLAQLYQAAEEKKVSLVVEADGSRSRPLKAPGSNEPAIPPWAELVITIAGLSVLGQAFSEATVHRVEPFKQITGLREGQPITLDCIAQLLASPLGGLKNSPTGAVKAALLNQADTKELCAQAAKYAPALLAAGYDMVLIGSLKNAPDELICFCH